MSRIKTKRRREYIEAYSHSFEWNDSPGAGFGFDSDKEGKVDTESMNPAALDNYQKCLNGTHDVKDKGIKDYSHWYTHHAVLQCDCGEELTLSDAMTNECQCGQLYNGSGQALAPRDQWEENWEEDY